MKEIQQLCQPVQSQFAASSFFIIPQAFHVLLEDQSIDAMQTLMNMLKGKAKTIIKVLSELDGYSTPNIYKGAFPLIRQFILSYLNTFETQPLLQTEKAVDAIQSAIHYKDKEMIKALVKHININSTGHRGTLLGETIYWWKPESGVEFVKFLLEQGASPTLEDRHGINAIHNAITKKSTELVRLFLNKEIFKTSDNSSLLVHASMVSSTEIVSLLLDFGANVNDAYEGNTPLHDIFNVETARLTPLQIARQHRRPAIESVLLEYGAMV